MGIIYWICLRIIKADFTPSFKVGNFNFFESAAAIECIFADRGDKIVLFYNFVIYYLLCYSCTETYSGIFSK